MTSASQDLDALRRKSGLVLAPLVFLALWVIPMDFPNTEGRRLIPILGATVVLWVTEAVPLPVTALFGPTLCVVLGVGPPKEIFRGFADPIIFVFLGSFLIAEAMLRQGLSRRIALRILAAPLVAGSPRRLLAAFGLVTAALSMWISNTATAAMMFPIAMAMLAHTGRTPSGKADPAAVRESRFGTGLLLMTAFAASVGGLATPVGTPPNLIGLSVIRERLGIEIPFFHWMVLGVPLTIALILFLAYYLPRACAPEPGVLENAGSWARSQYAALGRLTRGELNVLIAFGLTVILWMTPGAFAVLWTTEAPAYRWLSNHFPEGVVALIGAITLFFLPLDRAWNCFTLSWRDAARIDWGTILLFGGGLALGEAMFATGVAKWLGESVTQWLGVRTEVGLIIVATLCAVLVSETTSNAASAAMVVPVAIAISQSAGVNPLGPALAGCLGSSMGFMLPVSTPPNAIVFGSGCIPLTRMIRCGLLLDIAGAIVIITGVLLATPWLAR